MYIDSYTVYPTVSVYLSFGKYMYTKRLEPYSSILVPVAVDLWITGTVDGQILQCLLLGRLYTEPQIPIGFR